MQTIVRRGLVARGSGKTRQIFRKGDKIDGDLTKFNHPGSRKFELARDGAPVRVDAPTVASNVVTDIPPAEELEEMDLVELRQIAEDNEVALADSDDKAAIIAKLTGK